MGSRRAVPLRRSMTLSVLGAVALAGSAAYRRRRPRATERVDPYVADGSIVSLTDSAEAELMLGLARTLVGLER